MKFGYGPTTPETSSKRVEYVSQGDGVSVFPLEHWPTSDKSVHNVITAKYKLHTIVLRM